MRPVNSSMMTTSLAFDDVVAVAHEQLVRAQGLRRVVDHRYVVDVVERPLDQARLKQQRFLGARCPLR
jgi:hypothetical protein